MIEVDGVSNDQSAEAYALRKDGTASWMWIVNNGFGEASIQSKKVGTWTAEDGRIIISIAGNSGMIIETWRLQNGIFYDIENRSRHLKTKE